MPRAKAVRLMRLAQQAAGTGILGTLAFEVHGVDFSTTTILIVGSNIFNAYREH
jgi:hypothetical protein